MILNAILWFFFSVCIYFSTQFVAWIIMHILGNLNKAQKNTETNKKVCDLLVPVMYNNFRNKDVSQRNVKIVMNGWSKTHQPIITLIWIEVRFDIMSNLTTNLLGQWIVNSQSDAIFQWNGSRIELFVCQSRENFTRFVLREPFIMIAIKTTNDSNLMCASEHQRPKSLEMQRKSYLFVRWIC